MKPKNPAAQALGSLGGKARARNLSAEELSKIAHQGGLARNQYLTKEERRKLAKLAAKARWAKRQQAEREVEDAGQGGLERPE